MTDDPSKRIGDYEVLGVLGAGGMGKVFKVRNVISDRVEAMKILLPDLEGRQELAERFLREIKLLASLDHPNIAQLRTALTLSNRLVMVMEYVEGTTLAARLEQGPIPPDEAIGYVNQVLNALSYAHAKSVIHRDIKPANMMLTTNGTVKLMDFGIARAKGDASMTVTGTTLGSLFYMSPEQVKGGTVDPRSDLYSLGVSLYEMVTGELPFKAGSDYSIMTAQLQERPKPPSEVRPGLPPQLNGTILHSMAKEPLERFQSADEFRQALDAVRQSIPASAAPFAPVQIPAIPPPATAVAATPTAATGAFGGTPAPVPSTMSIPTPPVQPPQPIPSVVDLSPRPHRGRGLYMALGAAVVLVVLVLAGLSFPRWLKTRAAERQQKPATDQSAPDQNSSQNSSQTQNPPASGANSSNPNASGTQSGSSAQDSSKPSDGSAPPSADSGASTAPSGSTGSAPSSDANASSGSAAVPYNSASATPPKPSRGKSGKKGKSSSASGNDQGSSAANASGSGDQGQPIVDAAQKESVQDVEQEVDETSSRATASTQSLDNMKRQLNSQGMNLRGDIVSAQELMNSNLEKAHQALQSGDTKNAKRYLSMAQAQQEKIEKFLGH
jgi:serine/threonine-protein kinase